MAGRHSTVSFSSFEDAHKPLALQWQRQTTVSRVMLEHMLETQVITHKLPDVHKTRTRDHQEWIGQGSAPESVQSQAAVKSTIHACEVHGWERGRGFNSVLQVPPTVETAALDPSPTRQVGFARG